MGFTIKTYKEEWEVSERDLKTWITEHPLQQELYGWDGLCDQPCYRDERGSHNDAWFEYVDMREEREVDEIMKWGEKGYDWREYDGKLYSATVYYKE